MTPAPLALRRCPCGRSGRTRHRPSRAARQNRRLAAAGDHDCAGHLCLGPRGRDQRDPALHPARSRTRLGHAVADWPLFDALSITLMITGAALLAAVVGGAGLAILFKQSRLMEMSLYPMPSSCRSRPSSPSRRSSSSMSRIALSACFSAPGSWPSSRCSVPPRSASTPPTTTCATCSASTAHALAAAALPATALGPALFPRRAEDRGGLSLIGAVVAELCRWHRRHRFRPRLPHPGGGIPAQHRAHVRRPRHGRGHGRLHLRRAQRAVPPAAQEVARKRGQRET
jgi:hypothetical protein